ncbi:MAG: hypothetical protein ACYC1M_16720 [Armatimonadota bacterium]
MEHKLIDCLPWLSISLLMAICLIMPKAAQAEPLPLKYSSADHPTLKWGYNDLNNDGVTDTLITTWNGKTVALVFDSGRLPWPEAWEGQDWNAYLNKAFNVGQDPPAMWNPIRAGWGSYTLLVDRDGCGRFDSPTDWYYRSIDLNGDGSPEGEYYHLFPGQGYSNKLHFNLNGDRDMSFLDFGSFYYADEQRYTPGGRYIMNVNGSGFFLNSYTADTRNAWENPIAWYDLNCNGYVDIVMRAADTSDPANGYKGSLGEFEVAWELNKDTGPQRAHSLDMQLTYYNYDGAGLDYTGYSESIPQIIGLKGSEFLSENMAKTRLQPERRYLPYMDGYKIGTDFKGWKGVFLLFDEDNDDNRWEEMFAIYEPWVPYADKIGDRFERDENFKGEGKLYVGKFDGRIHLFHSEFSIWQVDYLGLYKGSVDRTATAEGPVPPAGLRYPQVKYSDTNGNGYIDRIVYSTVEFGNEATTELVERTVDLLAFADQDHPEPDVCATIDPRVNTRPNGWNISKWKGKPLTPQSFRGTSIKAGYDKISDLYGDVCDHLWSDAMMLYKLAKRFKLNRSESLDQGLKTSYTKQELADLKVLEIPKGYSRHLKAKTRREKYDNGYWLKEKVFADILSHSGLDRFRLEKYYYLGEIDQLCRYVEHSLSQGPK